VVGIGRHQVLQQRGPGAALTGDHQRLGDLLVVDLRVPFVGVLDLQPGLEEQQDLLPGA